MLPAKSIEFPYRTLAWWTWVVSLPVCFVGTLISLQAKIATGSSLFYFPLPFALTLAYWWGPRVLLGYYINAVLCAGFWGLTRVGLWPVYALPEVIFVFLSWLFYIKAFAGKVWLPDTKQMVYFLIAGILIPLAIYKAILEGIFVMAGDAPVEHYWNLVITTGFGDFISTFCVSLPLLHFLTRLVSEKGLFGRAGKIPSAMVSTHLSKFEWLELVVIAVIAWCINYFLEFSEYWFLNGILSLFVAMRFGFGATVLMNSYILVITYVIPSAMRLDFPPHFIESSMLKTQLGTTLLYVFSIISGRLVSDMRLSELRLSERNKELHQMNAELDRFVYSVSHDLSAPLKSILGLVTISRMSNSEKEHRQQFDLIEKSAHKLEGFISEVLDYSKNKRKEVLHEKVNLKVLSREIFDDLQFVTGFNEIELDFEQLNPETVISDSSRLKIILQNIFSNAIKFRRKNQPSYVKVSTRSNGSKVVVSIEDNGEGIRPEFQPKIFDMFFRGTDRSEGSGLGLYIAREAAKKINANISVKSTYGEGSVFNIELEPSKP